MKLLLDTHAFLWIVNGGPLSQRARQAFLNPENEAYLSAASYWEISIKIGIGRLVLADDWVEIFDREIAANRIKWLPIKKEHCVGIVNLPMIHRDPFDRMLIAQALFEKMTLLTHDEYIQQYDAPYLW
jgi:PIN domain nuclease of toxin-antitoxin system